jgi:hypothetical protein
MEIEDQMRSIKTAAFAISILSLTAGAPASAVSFGADGARGDNSNNDVCDPGQFLVGVHARTGAWIDQITIKCAKLNADRTLGPVGMPAPARGGSGGGEIDAVCPPNWWVTQISFSFTKDNRQVRFLAMRCISAAAPDLPTYLAIGPKDSSNNGTKNPQQECAAGEAATGLNSNSGAHVNALGLICAQFPPKAVATAPAVDLNAICRDYAARQAQRVTDAARLKCDFLSGSGGWNKSQADYEKACHENFGTTAAIVATTIKVSEDGLDTNLTECRKKAGLGATITKAVTMYTDYKDPKKDLCYLNPKDTADLLSAGAAPKPWLHLKGTSGGCKGSVAGFVYNQGEVLTK